MRALHCLLLLLVLTPPAVARQGPPPEIRALIDSFVQTAQSEDDESVSQYIAERFDPDYVAAVGREVLLGRFRSLRGAARTAHDLGVDRTERGLVVVFGGPSGQTRVLLGIPFQSPNLIRALEVEQEVAGAEPENLEQAIRTRARAFESLWEGGRDALEAFRQEHVAPAAWGDELDETLNTARRIGAAAGAIMLGAQGATVTIELQGPENAAFELSLQEFAPFLITRITWEPRAREELPPPPSFSWDRADEQLDAHAEDGFSGVVLLARNGTIELLKGVGPGISAETAFDIGSMPIDFTRAAVLLLAQQERLDLDAAITEYLPAVPEDKQAITVRHLMSGESGLPNYLTLPEDADADLTYIDRKEALRRILERELLFAPGTDNRHSHAAWTLLAAIVEMVSEKSYGDFLNESLFEPAGLERTGFYGADTRFSREDQADGGGMSRPTEPNKPLYWGPTSWLVMGAGGMVSTAEDLYRWHRFLREGGLLTGRYRDALPAGGLSMGDSDRGFLTVKGFTADRVAIVLSNSFRASGDGSHGVARGIAALALR